MSILDALERETLRTGDRLATLEEKDWARTTRCAPLNVLQLAAHAWRGSQRIHDMLDGGAISDTEAEKDRLTYWSYDASEGAVIVRRAQEVAAQFADGRALTDAWRTAWPRELERCRTVLQQDDPLFHSPFGVMRLSDYLTTRIVEVVVHTMDLRDALGLDPEADPEALEICADVLRGLLGTDLRSSGVGDVRFTLTGTGRAPLNDSERDMLGPLADKFPLLA